MTDEMRLRLQTLHSMAGDALREAGENEADAAQYLAVGDDVRYADAVRWSHHFQERARTLLSARQTWAVGDLACLPKDLSDVLNAQYMMDELAETERELAETRAAMLASVRDDAAYDWAYDDPDDDGDGRFTTAEMDRILQGV